MPPVFIVVCNNTAVSKLVYEWISGFERDKRGRRAARWSTGPPASCSATTTSTAMRLARRNTLLIDSAAARSRARRWTRTSATWRPARDRAVQARDAGAAAPSQQADNITDADLLREVMNTVGKQGRLGEQIRCVVSVSMLTEGWDTNTVTHILGVRAFGTQLLCEQVVGRGLRRQSYELNEERPVRRRIRRHPRHPVRLRGHASGGAAQERRSRSRASTRSRSARRSTIAFPRVTGYRKDAGRRAHHGGVHRRLPV